MAWLLCVESDVTVELHSTGTSRRPVVIVNSSAENGSHCCKYETLVELPNQNIKRDIQKINFQTILATKDKQ